MGTFGAPVPVDALPEQGEILAADTRSNGSLMADCARLGYLGGIVCDMTYGMGRFWIDYRPEHLIAYDIDEACGVGVADFRSLPLADKSVDTAVFDPPYKANGTSTGFGPSALDAGYGVDKYRTANDRLTLMYEGLAEALRIARRYVLVKCQDQITSGKLEPQTYHMWEFATYNGARMVDLLHVLGSRPQPPGTRQVHARRNYSSLLVLTPG